MKKLKCTKNKLNEAIKLHELKGVHKALEVIPMMNEREYSALCADVKENGFLNPVIINPDGYVIDGRARLCASIEPHIILDPPIEVLDPVDTMKFVISANVIRGHISSKKLKGVKETLEEE